MKTKYSEGARDAKNWKSARIKKRPGFYFICILSCFTYALYERVDVRETSGGTAEIFASFSLGRVRRGSLEFLIILRNDVCSNLGFS